jgi:hypothetical protein
MQSQVSTRLKSPTNNQVISVHCSCKSLFPLGKRRTTAFPNMMCTTWWFMHIKKWFCLMYIVKFCTTAQHCNTTAMIKSLGISRAGITILTGNKREMKRPREPLQAWRIYSGPSFGNNWRNRTKASGARRELWPVPQRLACFCSIPDISSSYDLLLVPSDDATTLQFLWPIPPHSWPGPCKVILTGFCFPALSNSLQTTICKTLLHPQAPSAWHWGPPLKDPQPFAYHCTLPR